VPYNGTVALSEIAVNKRINVEKGNKINMVRSVFLHNNHQNGIEIVNNSTEKYL